MERKLTWLETTFVEGVTKRRCQGRIILDSKLGFDMGPDSLEDDATLWRLTMDGLVDGWSRE